MFKDISKFDKTSDYLPLITAIFITDLIIIFLSKSVFPSVYLRQWYQKFNLSAVIADVAIILLVIIITRAIYHQVFDKFSIVNFILLTLAIQILHDIIFYIILRNIPRGMNKLIDMLQDYANEVSYYAIIGDSAMMISSCLIASYLANFDLNTNIIVLVVFAYILPYILN